MAKLPQFIDENQAQTRSTDSRETRRVNISLAKTFVYKKVVSEEELLLAIKGLHTDSYRARGLRLALIERLNLEFPNATIPTMPRWR